MGKQTAVAMTGKDELTFLNFLRKSADIRIFISFAPTKEELWVKNFVENETNLFIWNKNFKWHPKYAQFKGDKIGLRQGWYFIKDRSTAPVIEYSRHNFTGKLGMEGRVYWAKYFAAPEDLSYDTDLFDKWYRKVVRWIRKHGRQEIPGTLNTYYFPDAWNKYKNAL